MLFLTLCPVPNPDCPSPHQPPPDAAVRIHGVYASVSEARAAVGQLATEQPDLKTFVIDDLDHWLPVLEPVEGCRVRGDVEEIGSVENEDPSLGRTGSVCDVRRSSSNHNQKATAATAASVSTRPTAPPPSQQPSSQTDHHTRRKEAQRQHHQLEELLRAAVPAECPLEAPAYAALRGRQATLRAFERKLLRLRDEARQRLQRSLDGVRAIDDRHPEFVQQYAANYCRALREVGMRSEGVDLLRFFEMDDPKP